jgi:aspartyl-tRNA(Asn)/glutamyl-tRNA(Gln) amidotransferase subunit A
MAKNVQTLRLLHQVLAGRVSHDKKDPTNLTSASRASIAQLIAKRPSPRPITFGVPQEYNIEELSPIVREVWLETLQRLQYAGHTVKPVSLPSTQQALSAYYVLAPAEASSNLAKYDGVRYGSGAPDDTLSTHDQLFARTRHHGFGAEVRKRILLGAYSLSANAIDNYFMQAQRIRKLVSKDFDAVFSMKHPLVEQSESEENGVDAIICPTAPGLPPTFDQIGRQSSLDAYSGDVFTVPASLAGLPAISVPVKPRNSKDLPDGVKTVGMQVITQFGDDNACLDYAELLGQE